MNPGTITAPLSLPTSKGIVFGINSGNTPYFILLTSSFPSLGNERKALHPLGIQHNKTITNKVTNNKALEHFKILQWNSRGARGSSTSLQILSKDYNVICVQESLLKSSDHFKIKSFKVIRSDIMQIGHRGICTLIRENINFETVQLTNVEHASMEYQVFKFLSRKDPIFLVNIYRHPGLDTPLAFYLSLFNSLAEYNQVLFVGDFNAHHLNWGCVSQSDAGRKLMRAIEENDFVILNNGIPTFLHNSACRSVIDLALASPLLAPLCSNSVLDDTYGSDHFPVATEIRLLLRSSKKFCYKLKLKSEELNKLYIILKNTTHDIS